MNNNKMNAVKNSIISFVMGDVIGLNLIFIPKKILKESNIKDLLKNERNSNIPYGVWSDDSSMTLCTIKSIIDCNGVNIEDISKKFIAWFDDGLMTPYDKAFDIGQTTYNVLYNRNDNILKGLDDIKSNGNGSLMRILPVSLYCYFNKIRGTECFNLIKQVSSLTHAHPISILGCYIYTTIVFDILDGLDKSEILSDLKNIHLKIPKEYKHWLKEYDFSNLNINLNPSGYVANSLKVSLWGFINSDSIECCISNIAKLSGDMDTNCAIGASLSGLYYGLRGENITFDDEVIKKDMILNLIEEFTDTLKSPENTIRNYLKNLPDEAKTIFIDEYFNDKNHGFIQRPSCIDIINCLKNSKEIIYKKCSISQFREIDLKDVKNIFIVIESNSYSDLSDITEPLSKVYAYLKDKEIKFFGWDSFCKRKEYSASCDMHILIIKN